MKEEKHHIRFFKEKHLWSCNGGGNIFRVGEAVEVINGLVEGEYIIDENINDFSIRFQKTNTNNNE
jgi:hypothetical protein|tara:strand:+ start:1417 stop:1614 length:198 start_codon:yes stop_codon:yes gene_type:complete